MFYDLSNTNYISTSKSIMRIRDTEYVKKKIKISGQL